ncbi:hypothetical protein A6R68_03610, partial [Neotoma lepida]
MGAEVFDTDMVIVDQTITDICFENVTIFNEAGPDFQIKVEVYSCSAEDSNITNTPRKLAKKLKTSISKAAGKKIISALQEENQEACLLVSSAAGVFLLASIVWQRVLPQTVKGLVGWRRLYCALKGGKLHCFYGPEEIEAKVEPTLVVSID